MFFFESNQNINKFVITLMKITIFFPRQSSIFLCFFFKKTSKCIDFVFSRCCTCAQFTKICTGAAFSAVSKSVALVQNWKMPSQVQRFWIENLYFSNWLFPIVLSLKVLIIQTYNTLEMLHSNRCTCPEIYRILYRHNIFSCVKSVAPAHFF